MNAETRQEIAVASLIDRYAEQAEDALLSAHYLIKTYFDNPDRSKLNSLKLSCQNAAEMVQKYYDKMKELGGANGKY